MLKTVRDTLQAEDNAVIWEPIKRFGELVDELDGKVKLTDVLTQSQE